MPPKLKNPEFLQKRLMRFFLSRVKIPDYEPEDKFLKRLKKVLDEAGESTVKGSALNQIENNAKNFLLKLCDNDEAYRLRLIYLILLIKKTRFNFAWHEKEWGKAHYLQRYWKKPLM